MNGNGLKQLITETNEKKKETDGNSFQQVNKVDADVSKREKIHTQCQRMQTTHANILFCFMFLCFYYEYISHIYIFIFGPCVFKQFCCLTIV